MRMRKKKHLEDRLADVSSLYSNLWVDTVRFDADEAPKYLDFAAIFGNEKWFWANLFAKIGERSSDTTADTALSYAAVLKTVIGVFVKRAYAVAGAAAVIAWLTAFVRSRKHLHLSSSVTVLTACALLPFAWYFCTQNHSYIHAFYTSRNLAVTVFAACCLFTSFLGKNLYKPNDL